jgi:hypothetical protein
LEGVLSGEPPDAATEPAEVWLASGGGGEPEAEDGESEGLDSGLDAACGDCCEGIGDCELDAGRDLSSAGCGEEAAAVGGGIRLVLDEASRDAGWLWADDCCCLAVPAMLD